MKILHLILDHQVIERTLGVYEKVFPNKNDIIVFDNKDKYKHILKYSNSLCVKYGQGLKSGKSFDFSSYTHIIAHYMNMDMIDFIKSAPVEMHVTWEIYGADLYNQFLVPLGLNIYYSDILRYGKFSFFKKNMPSLFNYLLEIKGYQYRTKKNIRNQFDYITSRINSIQYCCRYDALYIEEYSKRNIPSYEIFNYSLNTVLGELKDSAFFDGEDILIGNSASFSNNHFYIFDLINSINSSGQLIIPLSYGGTKKYADAVQKKYESRYGDRVVTLREYMPLHDYNKIFTHLKVIILSAWRQESQGTAIMGFYLGIKVIMSNKSPLYKWFKDCGFIVYALEEATDQDFQTGLSMEQKMHNRELVHSRYNDDKIEETFLSQIH